MNPRIYTDLPTVAYEGPASTNPLAYRWYDASRVVLGQTLAEHLRPAVCYWHTFCWGGQDPFALGSHLFDRPWFGGEPLAAAQLKLDNAFDFFSRLALPFWCFHDRDVAPEGATLRESNALLDAVLERAADKMHDSGIRLLGGTANLFSHARYMSGAATSRHGRRCASRPRAISPARCSTRRCLEIAGRLMANGSASSETEASPRARRARIARRVGSARAAKVVLS